MRRNYKPGGKGHRRHQNWWRRDSRWENNDRHRSGASSDSASSSTSASSSGSTQSSSVPELPGFYYDPEKNRYFRLLPGHNNCNPLTKEGIMKKEMEAKRLQHLEDDKNRKILSRLGLNASLLLRKQQLGSLPCTTYCRHVHELKVSSMQRKEVSIVNPESVGAGTHKYEFILADSSCERLFVVNDVENGFCKYGLLNLNGLWKDVPTVESHDDNPYFTNQKVVTACWASVNAPDSHVLVCLLGKPEAPGCVSLIPACRFRNLAADYDDVRPEVVYNIRISNAWSCAWCLNPRLECSYAAGLRNQVLVLNVVTDVQHTFRTNSDVLAQQFATQTLLLYNGCRSGEVFSIDLRVPYHSPNNWKKGVSFSQSSGITCLRLLKDENYLVVSDMSGQIKLWDLRMVKNVLNYEGHMNSYAHLPVHVKEDEGLLLAVGQDCYTRIWNFQDARLLRTIPSPHTASKDSIPSVVFSSYHGGKRPVPGLLMAVKKYLYHFTYDSHDV
ncbi:DDB1- and CUL4-associated factor 4 [Bufo bufo]|uniref:DDB1- and CUL4-associated factor 4 n=1 Tax=Bufo bufo TaxID=8384 RepID=UPI001ABDE0A8|nr:DDB1- and CUL4-associated factor 4 [Bufo bufo]